MDGSLALYGAVEGGYGWDMDDREGMPATMPLGVWMGKGTIPLSLPSDESAARLSSYVVRSPWMTDTECESSKSPSRG